MDKETEVLSRLAANHLHLAQFEPFRAIILALRARNPELAVAVLQTVVARSGRFESVLWSSSCPSPSLLTYLSTIELLQFDKAPSIWSFDPETIRFRAEFLLLIQNLIDRVSESIRKNFDLESIEKEKDRDGFGESESSEDRAELLDKSGVRSEDLRDASSELHSCVGVLDKILVLGVKRLKSDLVNDDVDGGRGNEATSIGLIEEGELMCLRRIIWDYADVFDALCLNIHRQVRGWEGYDSSGLAITIRRDENAMQDVSQEEDVKVLGWIQKVVQMTHLDAMKECMNAGNVNGAISRIRFLHLDYGVEESEYRTLVKDLLKMVSQKREGYGDAWVSMREKVLQIYGAALASNCGRLIQTVQVLQDDLLLEEINLYKSTDSNQTPLPLQCYQGHVLELKLDINSCQQVSLDMAISFCKRELYHYARVSGSHVLGCIMETALSAIKQEKLEEASKVLSLFPRLNPLVAAMGWDILSGNTPTRRRLMQLLWTSKSQALQLEESSLHGSQPDEISCVGHLCQSLCYQLDLASFVAQVNSGQSWHSKFSLMLSGKEQLELGSEGSQLDPFVENFVLERLSVHSPLRVLASKSCSYAVAFSATFVTYANIEKIYNFVTNLGIEVLFDLVPGIKFEDAMKLIGMQPIASSIATWKRLQDLELMNMRYALQSAVLALGTMEKTMAGENQSPHQEAFCYLKDLKSHVEAISNIPRKIMMVNVIISLLHMDGLSFNLVESMLPGGYFESYQTCSREHIDLTTLQEGNKLVISFTELLLDILHHCIPSTVSELEHVLGEDLIPGGRQALEWRMSIANQFIEEWEWRLSILQHLLPLSERQWRWKEALAVLRAAPSKLLDLCMQRAKYDIGEEAVRRFSLSAEDKATLELAEWVDGAVRRTSVEDAVSRAADGTSTLHDLDFSSLSSQLGHLAAILLSIDMAASSARSTKMSQQLLDQAQVMLSEIYPGVPPKKGSSYWDQILEVGVISVSKRILKRLNEFLDQDNPLALPAILSGELTLSSPRESHRQGQRERAVAMLHQMIEDAHKGRRQFLSGKLHNLARALADEETEPNFLIGESSSSDQKVLNDFDKDGVLGLGLRVSKHNTSPTIGENTASSGSYDVKESGKRLFGPISTKPSTYLSQFILHVAAVGDIVDGADTTHDFNFFSLIYEWPKDLLTHLVFDGGSSDAAAKLAEIMGSDFVHEVISACVPPVYPPRSGHGWACIPVIPTCAQNGSESTLLSPSSKEAKPNCYTRFSVTPGIPLYPLQLDIVKHLVKLSPVRAVLACVFGSSILYSGSESSLSSSLSNGLMPAPDTDRLFYEFALDQSERFPTLNRWIQMQTNLHRVSEFAATTKQAADGGKEAETRGSIKRLREQDYDTDSEVDETVGGNNVSTASPSLNRQAGANPDIWHDTSTPDVAEIDTSVFLSFNWENEEPYEKTVERLIDEEKLMDALALSDRFLRNGASDRLLQLLIERGENQLTTGQYQSSGGHGIWSNSWQYCLRLKDKQLAARLALKYMHRWELDAALDVLTMCSCHLPQSDPIRNEVIHRRQALQRYSHILSADDRYSSWQEVEAECKEDTEGLALRLAGKGAVSAALEVAESAGLSIDLRRELQGRQLVKLLTADPLKGGGPAEASRFLSSLGDSDDALPVAMGAMQLLPNLRSKQLLVHFFLKRREGNLSDVEVSRLNSWALGLRVLTALPLPWQQRCSPLHEHPHLILEVLLMRKQLQSAALILKEFPSLRDNNVIIAYAAKSIAVSISSPPREHRVSVSGIRPKQKTITGSSVRSSFSNSLSNLQREARRAFSWGPRNNGEKSAPKDTYRKRKSSGLTPSERVAWEAMSGINEDHVSTYSVDGQERLPSISIAEEWMLTGDIIKDDAVRASHRYESSPDITLFKALLSLISNESVLAKSALELCVNQMKNVLSSQQLPENASMETIGRAYHVTETFVQGLLYAKSLLRKIVGGSDLFSNSERNRDADDSSSEAGSSGVGTQSTDELSEVLSQAEIWLRCAELLQSLLGSGIAASLDDIADKESSARLRDRLIVDERYSMAVYTCKKCKIDVFPVWNAWGNALIRMEHYGQARVKFKQALQLYKGDPAPVILEIINTIEGGPPVDVSAVRSMYEHLAKSAPTILDDSLSADSYLNVLYMPSTFPRSERSRRSQEAANNNSAHSLEFEDRPRSNLDSVRYVECVNYLQEYARQHLLSFMFRHGHYRDACMLFFPQDAAPPQPSTVGVATSSSSPQRSDPLATDYGTIDDLCDLCVGFGAMSVLEEVISERMSSAISHDEAVNQYTAAALGRICIYCETHRHFNFLYKFQVIKKDHVAAGLCCIQLFMNSALQEEANKHLEHAKMHFDEALSARYKGGDSTKPVVKGVRGKSASEKLSEEDLVKFSARVSIQVEVVKSFNDAEGPQWKHSLFGNPNDPDTFRRRCKIAETLAEKNFDLAFQVIYEFNLPAVDIYAGVASSLAERKKGSQLTEFFRNIKGTIDDDDWDQVLGAAINVYANKHKERPDRLIDMLTSSHRKVLACVVCGRLKSAFQIASRSGSVADVQYVAHQALHANALPVLDMCKQWLVQYM